MKKSSSLSPMISMVYESHKKKFKSNHLKMRKAVYNIYEMHKKFLRLKTVFETANHDIKKLQKLFEEKLRDDFYKPLRSKD